MTMGTDDVRRLLLISNSTLHGSGYLDHAKEEIRDLAGDRTRVVSFRLRSTIERHMRRAITEADVIFVGAATPSVC